MKNGRFVVWESLPAITLFDVSEANGCRSFGRLIGAIDTHCPDNIGGAQCQC